MGKNKTRYSSMYTKPELAKESPSIFDNNTAADDEPVEETPLPVISDEPKKPKKYVVKTPVNLRVTPGVRPDNLLGVLKIGAVVELRNDVEVKDWTPVHYQRYDGWVMSEYLEEV